MTTLTITPDHAPDQVQLHTDDFDIIQRELAAIGVPMTRWRADVPLAPDATPETVLEAYAPAVAALNADSFRDSVVQLSRQDESLRVRQAAIEALAAFDAGGRLEGQVRR